MPTFRVAAIARPPASEPGPWRFGVLAAFSRDGKRLLVAEQMGAAQVLDAESGREVWSLPERVEYGRALFALEGDRFAIADAPWGWRIRVVGPDQKVLSATGRNGEHLRGCALSRDERRLLVASSRKEDPLTDYNVDRIWAVDLASGAVTGPARIWDDRDDLGWPIELADGSILGDEDLGGRSNWLELSADGSHALLAPERGGLRLIEVASKRALLNLPGDSVLAHARLSAARVAVASGSRLAIRDFGPGAPVIEASTTGPVAAMAASADGSTLFTLEAGALCARDAATLQLLATWRGTSDQQTLAVSPSGRLLTTGLLGEWTLLNWA